MAPKILLLMLICLLIAFFMKSDALVMIIGAGLFILILPDLIPVKKSAKKKDDAKKEQEIIYPVIYEDTGEAPYLFPKKFEVKVFPKEQSGTTTAWATMFGSVGNVVKVLMWSVFGKKKK